MKWSFSSLVTYEQCPMLFKLKYIDHVPDEDNGFSQYGTFCHSLFEGWAKDKIPSFALADEYTSHFDEHVTKSFPPFPRGLMQKYYDQGLRYFETFDEFGGGFDILSVEEKFEIDVGGHTIVGLADLVIRSQKTGEITVIDHKSKSSSTMAKDLPVYRRQLYIYAMYVHQRFGVYPTYLKFNLFRENEWVTEEFSEEGLEETKAWILSTISTILAEKEWPVNPSSYFCKFICGVFSECPAQDVVLNATPKEKKEADT